jgi:VCBS repeat-containing protein
MRYVMSNKWSLTEHFVISDESGDLCFDVRGNLGLTQRLTFLDQSGQEVAEIRKHLMTTAHDILVGGQRVAEVRHTGFFGEHYQIDSSFGQFTAKGSFTGWDYTISHAGQAVATISREFAFREKFLVQTADGGNDIFILAIVLAIDSIHDERRERERDDRGFGGGLGGIIGGNFP